MERFESTRMAWGKDPRVNLVLVISVYVATGVVLATYLFHKRNQNRTVASNTASLLGWAYFSGLSAFLAILLLTSGEGVWKSQALGLLVLYGLSTFIFVSEWLIARGARYLTRVRGDRWIKELEYLYVALGTIGVVGLLNKWDRLGQPWEKIDLVAPVLFATAVVVKLIKTRAEIGRWSELK